MHATGVCSSQRVIPAPLKSPLWLPSFLSLLLSPPHLSFCTIISYAQASLEGAVAKLYSLSFSSKLAFYTHQANALLPSPQSLFSAIFLVSSLELVSSHGLGSIPHPLWASSSCMCFQAQTSLPTLTISLNEVDDLLTHTPAGAAHPPSGQQPAQLICQTCSKCLLS